MANLETIRKNISKKQTSILSAIWDYFLNKGEWIPERVLHKEFGGKAIVKPLLEQLGGSIVFLIDKQLYQLSMLGMLLTNNGEHLEQLLIKYLVFISLISFEEPERTHVSSAEAAQEMKMSRQDILSLGILLRFGFSGSGSFGDEQWNVEIPKNIEDISYDIHSYFHAVVSKDYDPDVPIDPIERQKYLFSLSKPIDGSSLFAFVIDEKLRTQLESDWREANVLHSVNAWKSCVVICGGILEGLLIDVLQAHSVNAKRTYKKLFQNKTLSTISRWSLEDMVDVAKDLHIIGKGSFHLSHALRQYRNLIHPTKQVAEGVEITIDSANIGISSIRTFANEINHYYNSNKS